MSLYNSPDIYARVFSLDAEEVDFFGSLLARLVPVDSFVIDAGCGDGELASQLSRLGWRGVGLDRCGAMLRSRAREGAMPAQGDIRRPPFRRNSVAAVVSRLFGFAYAGAADAGALSEIAGEWREILAGGAMAALELPVCHEPSRIQGLEERAFLGDGLVYRFQYLDVLAKTDFGCILDSVIEVVEKGCGYDLRTPIHVYTPGGICEWMSLMGFGTLRWFAPYDLSSEAMIPPADMLRAIVVATR